MKIFFSGIGGSGVSAIAGFMRESGHAVSGSDRLFDMHPDSPVATVLRAAGIVIVPQDGRTLDRSVDLAVFSTAVEESNSDFIAARRLGLRIKTRPELLVDLVSDFKTIAVAGTSGKSTVAGMLAFLMKELGMKPNFIGGGRVRQFRSDHNPGNYLKGDSDLLVAEACESDGSVVNYTPTHTILLNLELDHHGVGETSSMFETLAGKTSNLIILNGDDKRLLDCAITNKIIFSLEKPSDYQARQVKLRSFSSAFQVNGVDFMLNLPGRYNLCNALACIVFLSEIGIPLREISPLLPEFRGIERRFDIHLHDGKHFVVDDYAHNPHKIMNLMQSMKNISDRVLYIFQPHGFGPTRLMKEEYIDVFSSELRDSDQLILLPVYYVGGTVAKDISSEDISSAVSARGRRAGTAANRAEILRTLGDFQAYVIFGARDESLSDFAGSVARQIQASDHKVTGRPAST